MTCGLGNRRSIHLSYEGRSDLSTSRLRQPHSLPGRGVDRKFSRTHPRLADRPSSWPGSIVGPTPSGQSTLLAAWRSHPSTTGVSAAVTTWPIPDPPRDRFPDDSTPAWPPEHLSERRDFRWDATCGIVGLGGSEGTGWSLVHRSVNGRKVRAPQSRVVGNADRSQDQGKCHRKQTASLGLHAVWSRRSVACFAEKANTTIVYLTVWGPGAVRVKR